MFQFLLFVFFCFIIYELFRNGKGGFAIFLIVVGILWFLISLGS